MLKLKRSDFEGIPLRIGVIAGIIILVYAVISFGMKSVNKSMGIEETTPDEMDSVEIYTSPESLYTSQDRVTLPEMEELPEGPEASWVISPCSIFVSESSRPVLDSLPTAPDVMDKPLEALFLVKLWAAAAGIEEEKIDQVYVFTRFDTIYVDLPVEKDFPGLKLTIENRFICFTRMFPLVGGNLLSSYPEGISLRGTGGVFRQ